MIGDLPRTAVIEKGGLRIGLIGIAEKEWYETIPDLENESEFLDEKKTATELVR